MKVKAVAAIIVTLFLVSTYSTTFMAPATATPDNSIVGLWHFDKGTGSTAYDSSGYGNDGTLLPIDSEPTWVAGKFEKALNFDGVNDYVEVLDDDSLDITTELTIEAWVRTPVHWDGAKWVLDKSHQQILDKGEHYSYSAYMLMINDGKLEGRVNKDADTSCTYDYPTDGEWHHVAYTFKSGEQVLYIDGTAVASKTKTTVVMANDQPLYIGNAVARLEVYQWWGKIDEIRLWHQALTNDQVKASFDLRFGTKIDEKDLNRDKHLDLIFTSAFHNLEDTNMITITILPADPSVKIDPETTGIKKVTPKRTDASIIKGSLSASGYSLPITVFQGTPPCNSIHLQLYLTTGDRVGVNAHFLPYS